MKNDFEIRGDITAILLKSKKYGAMETLISTNKLERAMEFTGSYYPNWDPKLESFYVIGNMPRVDGKQKMIRLHRWITNALKGMEVDHFNHKTLDNTDDNLKVITTSENQQNRKGADKDSKSGIRGVYWHKRDKIWCVHIAVNGKQKTIGSFSTIEESEAAAVAARIKYMPFSQEAINS